MVPQCAESLARIQAGLTNTANKRERVKILHKKSESHCVVSVLTDDRLVYFYLFIYGISFGYFFNILTLLLLICIVSPKVLTM